MGELWHLQGQVAPLSGADAVAILEEAAAAGQREIWFESSVGRLLAYVTNGERAMVMLLDEPGDPGGHAIDPRAERASTGFVLVNGQVDTYCDQDTLPCYAAERVLVAIIDTGAPPADVWWQSDR